MQLAKAVASAAAALVLKAKNVAQKTEDSALQTQVIAAATQCALSTSQLVACTKVSTNPHLAAAGTRSLCFLWPQLFGTYSLGVRDSSHRGHGMLDGERGLQGSNTTQLFSCPAGGGSHHQLPGVPGAADRGWQAGSQVSRGLCGGL